MVMDRVAILIASQSNDIARGAAWMVRELFDNQVRCAYCHCADQDGDRRNVRRIRTAIETTVTSAGLVVCVDFGYVEMLIERGIGGLPRELRKQVRISDGPIIEGAIVAATIAARGATLDEVRAATGALCVKSKFSLFKAGSNRTLAYDLPEQTTSFKRTNDHHITKDLERLIEPSNLALSGAPGAEVDIRLKNPGTAPSESPPSSPSSDTARTTST